MGRFWETNWQPPFRGDTILGHKPLLGFEQMCPWMRKWNLWTLGNQIVAAKKNQRSLWIGKWML
jgi:hypothetical protein